MCIVEWVQQQYEYQFCLEKARRMAGDVEREFISGCACCSVLATIINLVSDFYVFQCEVDPLVSTSLANWWVGLSCFSIVIGSFLCFVTTIIIQDPRDGQGCGQWVILAMLCEYLPLLVLSFITLHNMPADMCKGSSVDISSIVSLTFAFEVSSGLSILLSLCRLVKWCGLLGCETDITGCQAAVHSIAILLSGCVFLYAGYLTCIIH